MKMEIEYHTIRKAVIAGLALAALSFISCADNPKERSDEWGYWQNPGVCQQDKSLLERYDEMKEQESMRRINRAMNMSRSARGFP